MVGGKPLGVPNRPVGTEFNIDFWSHVAWFDGCLPEQVVTNDRKATGIPLEPGHFLEFACFSERASP